MIKTLITQITDCIEYILNRGGSKNIIVYPCGDVGIQAINVMRNIYSIEPVHLIDNHKSKYATNIHEVSYLKNINTDNYILFLTSINKNIYKSLMDNVIEYFSPENIVELECMRLYFDRNIEYKTKIGKYSYGPICTNSVYIESIGSFCSFAQGSAYVGNHEMQYITTHPMIYCGKSTVPYVPYDAFKGEKWYFPDVNPKAEKVKKLKRATIGNDVWLGQNVIVTNGASIGNGVIAAAGAVITKDVPDYAIVAGIPAKIIKYRYTPEQIEKLNRIAWWDWDDDKIRERYYDFYLPIEEFVEKYK